jgi:hypothetical protein
MREAAGAAVMQHVLYLEGEVLPRPELGQSLEVWTRLHRLIADHICPATRTQPLDPGQVQPLVEGALASCTPAVSAALVAHLERALERCATCTPADACPLLRQ